MKKLLLVILTILFTASIASAAYLTCDPQPASAVTKYRINLNGEALPAGIENVGEDQVRIHYNIDHLEDGEYVVSAQAGNDNGEWSPFSNVLEFHRGVPTPQNIGLYSVIEEPVRISQEDWSVYSVSSESSNNIAINAIDGDANTWWHSIWGVVPEVNHPHEVQIDLGRQYEISGFYYLPRQDENWNGTIKQYKFYASENGVDWEEAVSGEFEKVKGETLVEFSARTARYISLVALSEVNDGTWTTIAEINILGY